MKTIIIVIIALAAISYSDAHKYYGDYCGRISYTSSSKYDPPRNCSKLSCDEIQAVDVFTERDREAIERLALGTSIVKNPLGT